MLAAGGSLHGRIFTLKSTGRPPKLVLQDSVSQSSSPLVVHSSLTKLSRTEQVVVPSPEPEPEPEPSSCTHVPKINI